MTIKTICIVEPLASVNYLATRLKEEGFNIIAIVIHNNFASNSPIAKKILAKKVLIKYELWDKVINFDYQHDNLQELAIQLAKLKVNYIYYGCEYVVPFTDQLNVIYASKNGNNPKTSLNRYDKFAMQEVLRQNNLLIPRQAIINKNISPLELERITDIIKFPLIIKPNNLAGSIGVYKIDNQQRLLDTLIKETEIDQFVAQEFIVGDEYIVDTFSLNGRHSICQIGLYKKEFFHDDILYRYMLYIAPSEPIYTLISEYIIKVLDTTELNNGFAHTELFVTQAQKLYLVEINPRISGASGFLNLIAKQCGGNDQVDLLKNAVNNLPITPYPQNKNGMIVFIYNFNPKRIYNGLQLDLITSLPSYFYHAENIALGTKLKVGGDLGDTICFIGLVHEDKKQLEKDYVKLIEYEKNDFLLKL